MGVRPTYHADAGDVDERLYLVEGVELIDGERGTLLPRGEAFVWGLEHAEWMARRLRARGWLRVRCVVWEG